MKLIRQVALINVELLKPKFTKSEYNRIVDFLKFDSEDAITLCCINAFLNERIIKKLSGDIVSAARCVSDALAEAYYTDNRLFILSAIRNARAIKSTENELIELLKGTDYEIKKIERQEPKEEAMRSPATWLEMINIELKEHDDKLVFCTLTDEEMNIVFDSSFGYFEGKPFTAWGEKRVYFPGGYDGAETVYSVPRNPCDEIREHVGGGGGRCD